MHQFPDFNEKVIIQSQCKLFVISRGVKLCHVSSYTAYNCILCNCTYHIIRIIYDLTSLSRRVVSCLGHFTWHRDHWISRYCCYYNTTTATITSQLLLQHYCYYNTTSCTPHNVVHLGVQTTTPPDTLTLDSKVLFSNALHAVHKLNQTLHNCTLYTPCLARAPPGALTWETPTAPRSLVKPYYL